MTKRKRGSQKLSKKASNLKKTLTQFVQGKRYFPSTFSELTHQLDIPDQNHRTFKEVLDDLVEKGELSFQEEKYAPLRSKVQENLTIGVINVLPKGFGFVRVATGPDVFVPKSLLMGAVDKDTVEVKINPHVGPKGPEGEVTAILKRGRTHLAGTITEKQGDKYLAYAPLLGIEKPVIVHSDAPLKEGDRVICQVKSWKNAQGLVEGNSSSLIGHISDPSIDIQAAVEEFELPHKFSQEAIEEAQSFGKRVKIDEGRLDLRDWETVTIDPKTAKDFDDAISLVQDERGHFVLGVHIADVSHYVKVHSHLDKEAYLRCNSTYFPGTCVPMLPFDLSNELCSLKPKVARLTQSVFMEFSPSGDLVDYKIERTCIKSNKRFSYEEALEVLEGKKKSPHLPLLKRMVDLCHLLKKKRQERGSIDFSMPSRVLIVDDQGVPKGMETVEYDITHQMIEEFMLKANEIVATHLTKVGKKLIYRVHEEPTAESYEDFYKYARSLGFFLPKTPSREDIQNLFVQAKSSPFLPQLSVSFIRSMRLAAYSMENLGHYGLALDYYCHFTSPIRRYTDLIIQRLLFDEIPPLFDIQAVADACSEKERVSFRAESQVTLLKKLRLAQKYFEEDPKRVYQATVTKIKPFALFFEVSLFDLEGTIHVSELGNDFYEYNPKQMSFKGSKTGQSFIAGDPIEVELTHLNLSVLQSVWAVAHQEKRQKSPKKKRGRRAH